MQEQPWGGAQPGRLGKRDGWLEALPFTATSLNGCAGAHGHRRGFPVWPAAALAPATTVLLLPSCIAGRPLERLGHAVQLQRQLGHVYLHAPRKGPTAPSRRRRRHSGPRHACWRARHTCRERYDTRRASRRRAEAKDAQRAAGLLMLWVYGAWWARPSRVSALRTHVQSGPLSALPCTCSLRTCSAWGA